MKDDTMRPPDHFEHDSGSDDPSDEVSDIAAGIWGESIEGSDGSAAKDRRPDPVARFKDRLRRGAMERSGRPSADES